MNRGDIWQADLGGRSGKRPVLILTRQIAILHLNKVTVAEITTKGKGYPTEVAIRQKGNLPKESYIQLDNIQTLSRSRLIKYLGTLDGSTMRSVSRNAILALGLDDVI
jgi:mRNA interferase MazF